MQFFLVVRITISIPGKKSKNIFILKKIVEKIHMYMESLIRLMMIIELYNMRDFVFWAIMTSFLKTLMMVVF
jgi:hypothetical protein